jgi:hypothetical protein
MGKDAANCEKKVPTFEGQTKEGPPGSVFTVLILFFKCNTKEPITQ